MNHLVAPSLLACDFSDLPNEVQKIDESEADWLHLDVMDGHFVPNITFGMPIVEAAHTLTNKPLDVHLMIEQPDRYVQDFHEAGADVITVHYEACPHLHRVVQLIKSTGARAGVALNPHTSVDSLEDVLEELDLVCMMSVNPGFGGQKFIYQALLKIEQIKDRIITRNLDVLVEVDGGVGLHNAEKILRAGADVLVAGSSIFKSDAPAETIAQLKEIGAESRLV